MFAERVEKPLGDSVEDSLGSLWSLKGGKKMRNAGQALGEDTGEARRSRKELGY